MFRITHLWQLALFALVLFLSSPHTAQGQRRVKKIPKQNTSAPIQYEALQPQYPLLSEDGHYLFAEESKPSQTYQGSRSQSMMAFGSELGDVVIKQAYMDYLGSPLSGSTPTYCVLSPVTNNEAQYIPFTIDNAEVVLPSDITSDGHVVGSYNSSNLWKAFVTVVNPDATIAPPSILPTGVFEQTFAHAVSDNGIIVGAGCRPGKCNCLNPFANPSLPSCSCKMEAIRWQNATANPTPLVEPGSDIQVCPPTNPTVHRSSEAVDISADGTRIIGTIYYAYDGFGDTSDMLYWKDGPQYQLGVVTCNDQSPPTTDCNPANLQYSSHYRGEALSADGQYAAISYRRLNGFTFPHIIQSTRVRIDGQPPYLIAPALSDAQPIISQSPNNLFPMWRAGGISPNGVTLVGSGLSGSGIASLLNYNISIIPDSHYTISYSNCDGAGSSSCPAQLMPLRWNYGAPSSSNLGTFVSPVFDCDQSPYYCEFSPHGVSNNAEYIVGDGYAGGESAVPGSDFWRTAFISPSISGNTGIFSLKSDLYANANLNIDQLSLPHRFQLISASGITTDASTIIGSVVCDGAIDGRIYGYIVRVSSSESPIPADFNNDGDVDSDDYALFLRCLGQLPTSTAADCVDMDFNSDSLIDELDAAIFAKCFSGTNVPADPLCYSKPPPYVATLPGDFDGNGVVDIADYSGLSICYGQDPQSNPPCAWADLTENGVIDDDDFEAFLACFGTSDPLCYTRPPKISLSSEASFPLGRAPQRVTLADFNYDGKLDVASVQGYGGTITVLPGDGEGSMGTPIATLPNYGFASDIQSGNFDQSPFPDLVLAGGSGTLIYLNNGSGGFNLANPATYVTGSNVRSVAIGDFNGDFFSDLATIDYATNGKLTILLGNGLGNFQISNQVSLPYGSKVVAADIDSDGDLDLVTLSNNSYVTIFTNNGSGQFSLAQSVRFIGINNPASQQVGNGLLYGMAIADFTADGAPDIAVSAKFSEIPSGNLDNQVYLLRNLNDGTGNMQWNPQAPQPFQAINHVSNRTNPLSLTSADFNGDGRADLALGAESNASAPGEFVVLLGRSSPGGGVSISNRAVVGYGTRSIQAGDFNNDGMPDLAAVNAIPASDSLSIVLTQIGEDPITFGPMVDYQAGDATRHVVVADFNSDGLVDVASSGRYSASVDVRLNSVSNPGILGPLQSYFLSDATAMEVADFGFDGIPDLACISPQDDKLGILYGTGSGQFTPVQTHATGDSPSDVVRNDFNEDGIIDLLVSNFRDSSLNYFAGNGPQGGFVVSSIPGIPSGGLTIADFNRDSHQDLALSRGTNVNIYLGDGSGGISLHASEPAGYGTYESVAADFDRDGILDIAVTGWNSNDVTILRGLGNGHFENRGRYMVGANPQGLVRGDFDGDGFLDLAVVSNGFSKVAILRGRQGMGFGWAGEYRTGKGVQRIQVTDLNRDGVLDYITANAISDSISVAFGTPH